MAAALLPKTTLQLARRQSAALTSVAVVQSSSCNYSQKPRIIKNSSLSSLKRGTGGRSSFNGIVCTVFGASGFIGKNLVNRLGRSGTQIIIPYRGDHYDVAKLKVCGDLGQVLFHPFHLKDEESIRKCIKYSNVVVNLIGRDYETKNFKYNDVHVEGAARLARICKEMGVERFIHLSCLNSTPEPEPILLPEGSKFFKSKWEGEWAVKREFPEATVIKPSDIYGTEDRFIGLYGHRWRMHLKGVPLLGKGEKVEKNPIWIGDVVSGIVAAIKNHESAGRTYQFVGPKRYKLSDIVDCLHWYLRREAPEYGYRRLELKHTPLFKLKVKINEAISPAYPLGNLHMEGLEKEHTSDRITKGVPMLQDLGVEPIPLNSQFIWEATPFRFDASFEYTFEEFGEVELPKPIA